MDTTNRNSTYNILVHWHNFKLKLVFEGIVVGILAGLLIVFYRWTLEQAALVVTGIYKALSTRPFLIPLWVGVLLVIGYIVGRLIKYEPMIKGSGIPQVEGLLIGRINMDWLKVIIGKYIGGALVIGAGLSLGREGPSVQLGAAVGQGFGKIFKRMKIEERYLVTSGASAGLAAAFNAPLAGVMFALEEVHKSFSPFVLLSAFSAAIAADFVSSGFLGLTPVFNLDNVPSLPLNYYGHIIILGAMLGVFGAVFNKTLLGTQRIYSRLKQIPQELWVTIPLLITVALGFFLPQVLRGGHALIVSVLTTKNFALKTLLLLLLVKFLFTMVSYGSGAPGGIFFPLLTIGALIGSIYGTVLVNFFQFDSMYLGNFVILAMVGYFTAIARAPLTGIILITELVGSFSNFLSITVVSITAYIFANLLRSKPIYESLYENIIHEQAQGTTTQNNHYKVLLELPISMGSVLDGQKIKAIKWPANCLLVAVKRGEQEIIPRGNTVMQAGDYLLVLTNENTAPDVHDQLIQMSNHQ
ncbi:MAG: ClC family H(+)/Cl(-) exchange transporter [Firmicutes bacterium]|nr:ClC family H(+)/Cl(-) exchange transporter [Bacillota bacterium]